MKKVIYLLATTLALHTFFLNAQISCPNLVTNGDFEAGNTGFTSGLTLDCNSSSCNTGAYCVTTNFNLKCNTWPNFADHTPTGVGNFLAIDGSTTAATNVWSTTVTATAGTPYTFSFWYASIYPSTSQSFDLGMMVNGTLVNTITVSQVAPNVPQWVQYTFSGTTPVNNPTIAIRQLTPGAFRDFGLDDIVFSACNQGCNMAITITKSNVSCNGGSSGTASASATGGTAPYVYRWSNTATTPTITNLLAGVYTVTVTDSLGCTATATTTITQPPVLSVVATTTNPTITGGSNGKIGFAISGGTPPYTTVLKLSGATIAPTQIPSPQYNGLIKGPYQYTVTDANGCILTGTVTLTEPGCILNGSISVTNVSCNSGSNGTVTVTVIGGNSPYSYKWSNTATTATITNLAAGVYTVTITDAIGCQLVTTAIVTQPTALFAVATPTNPTTVGGTNGKIGFTISGGTPPYTTVLKLNGATIAPTQIAPPQYNNLVKGIYQFTVTDANGCVSTGSTILSEPTAIDEAMLLPQHIIPNPNTGIFTFDLPIPATAAVRLRVTDITGKVLLEKQTEVRQQRQTVEATTLPNGLYFLQVVSEGRVVAVEKFVKE